MNKKVMRDKHGSRVLSSRFGNGNLVNSKRSMEMIISVLIVIALALLVFGVLAYVFSGGFAKFWNNIKGYFSSDVDAARNACDNACKTQSKYSYCCVQRDVNFGKVKENVTCMDNRIKQTCDINCSGEC